MATRKRRRGLSLYDFNDAELLSVIKDNADAGGWVTSLDLARALGFPEDEYQSVVVRLSWMRRFGVVEREKDRKSDQFGNWRLTDDGEAAIRAAFTPAQARSLANVKENQLWLLMQFSMERYAQAEPVQAILARRQAQVGFNNKKRR